MAVTVEACHGQEVLKHEMEELLVVLEAHRDLKVVVQIHLEKILIVRNNSSKYIF